MAPYRVAKSLTFAYGHRLRSHDGPCRHAHGHNAHVEVECAGDLDAQGMVVDFKAIQRVLGGWIRENWDHRMILQTGDPLLAALTELQEPVYELEGPPTAENLAAHLFHVARDAGLPVSAIRFWETPTSMACYTGS